MREWSTPRGNIRRAAPAATSSMPVNQRGAEMSGNGTSRRQLEWSNGYFGVDAEGYLRVYTKRNGEVSIRLKDAVDALAKRGLGDPLMIRFPQLLSDRQARINQAFADAIKTFDYPRHYQGVYPVKVNHERVVVETLVRSGHKDRFGLEVGSKAELCLALTMEVHPEAFIVCNGFKDREYLELAVHASKHGRRVLVIAENPQEIEDITSVVRNLHQRVLIGFRARLHSEGTGRWQESSGAHGKFGLSTIEILEGIERLQEAELLEDLICLHFHNGSQICDILNVKEAIKEATRLYCCMKERAKHLQILDMGGGLGVDYDGSRTATDWSMNYSLDEYARDAVYLVREICERAKVEPPILMTESGRALTAYHAVIILSSLRVLGAHEARSYDKFPTKSHQVQELKATLAEINASNYRESFHDATLLRNELLLGFKMGYVGLDDRAVGESLYQDVCLKVRGLMKPTTKKTPDMIELERHLATRFVCNFSVFMSAPDTWAVQQLFPVSPIARLNETPTLQATIGDITCDSDGKLDRFIGQGEPEPYIMLHDVEKGKPYHIAMFLTGAYQDVLGDFHNLFGTVNEGVVIINDEDDFSIVDYEEGSSVEHSLDYFGFAPSTMVRSFDKLINRELDLESIKDYKGAFLRVLHGNTYLQRLG
jgi:arginine decarboxylase